MKIMCTFSKKSQ